MTHRRKEVRNARLVTPHMARLARHLGHHDAIETRIEIVPRCAVVVELIPKDQYDPPHGRARAVYHTATVAGNGDPLRFRQASLQ
jgi:hypothetical protein